MTLDKAESERWIAKQRADFDRKERTVRRLLKPKAQHREVCTQDTLSALENVDYSRNSAKYFHQTRPYKDALRKFEYKANELKNLWNEVMQTGFEVTPDGTSVEFGVDIEVIDTSVETLVDFGKRCKAFAANTEKLPDNLDAKSKRLAVRLAYQLMVKHSTESPTVKRVKSSEVADRSTFPKVAAILWGNPEEDLSRLCGRFITHKNKPKKRKAQNAQS